MRSLARIAPGTVTEQGRCPKSRAAKANDRGKTRGRQEGGMSEEPGPRAFRIEPKIRLSDGRVIGSIADAIALVREHESRPGVDDRDEVLHRLERARTDEERQTAVRAFFEWAKELRLPSLPPRG